MLRRWFSCQAESLGLRDRERKGKKQKEKLF